MEIKPKSEDDILETEQLNEILAVRRKKLSELREDGDDPFMIRKFDVTAHSGAIKKDFEKMEGSEVVIAGRIMSKRGMGKASFCDVQDRDGRIQVYVRIEEIGEQEYEKFLRLDIGDIIGITGTVFKTHRGEISVKAKSAVL
ncbi:MAG: OB-fold nucleic acid binding domain-containing protein, partial [Eubacteriales bacterium]|nr:OB-fold nucleic acid binding domain-containing protein [Eubacteriales bacterium]